MADEVPIGSFDLIHLRHRFLDPILTQVSQAGLECEPANAGVESLGHGDECDVVGVPSGTGDSFSDRGEPFGDFVAFHCLSSALSRVAETLPMRIERLIRPVRSHRIGSTGIEEHLSMRGFSAARAGLALDSSR